MKNFITRALACVAALAAASSAYAAPSPSDGHYEWRINPRQQPGPRAPLLAPQRVWVAMPAMMSKESRASDRAGMMATSERASTVSCMSHCAS